MQKKLGGKFNTPHLISLSNTLETHVTNIDKSKYSEMINLVRRSYEQKLINSILVVLARELIIRHLL